MLDLTNWLMVFLRVSAMLAIFPVFSAGKFSGSIAAGSGSAAGRA